MKKIFLITSILFISLCSYSQNAYHIIWLRRDSPLMPDSIPVNGFTIVTSFTITSDSLNNDMKTVRENNTVAIPYDTTGLKQIIMTQDSLFVRNKYYNQ